MEYRLDKGAHFGSCPPVSSRTGGKIPQEGFTNDDMVDFLKQKVKEIGSIFDVEIYYTQHLHKVRFL